jgi:hypothetical protein
VRRWTEVEAGRERLGKGSRRVGEWANGVVGAGSRERGAESGPKFWRGAQSKRASVVWSVCAECGIAALVRQAVLGCRWVWRERRMLGTGQAWESEGSYLDSAAVAATQGVLSLGFPRAAHAHAHRHRLTQETSLLRVPRELAGGSAGRTIGPSTRLLRTSCRGLWPVTSRLCGPLSVVSKVFPRRRSLCGRRDSETGPREQVQGATGSGHAAENGSGMERANRGEAVKSLQFRCGRAAYLGDDVVGLAGSSR